MPSQVAKAESEKLEDSGGERSEAEHATADAGQPIQHREGVAETASDDDTFVDAILAESVSYGPGGIKGIVSSPFVFGAAFLASMGGFSFGYDQGVISIINVMPQFLDYYHQVHPSNPGAGFYKGFMTGMLELGACLGCFFMPKLADKISRKWALSIVVVIFNVGAIIQTASPDYATLVAGRTIGGMGVGTLALGAPLYISEISPPHLRGALLVLESFSIVGGVLISYWITYGTRFLHGQLAFRLPFGLQMVCATILGFGIHLFPYSPRWLAMVHREDDALQTLSKLRRLPTSDDRVLTEYRGILGEVEFQKMMLERNHPGKTGFKLELSTWIDLFKRRTIRRTTIACGIAFFQQFIGINAFIYYAPSLFSDIGQSYETSLILSGLINVGQFLGVCLAFFLMDAWGRRPLAVWGAFLMVIPYSVISALIATYSNDWKAAPAAGWIAVAMAYVFIFIFGASYSPLAWALPPELFSNASRAKGVALSTATIWFCNFIIGVAVPPMIESIGYGTYVFFACFCFLAGVFSFFLVPETAGKTLEEMDAVFGDSSAQEEMAIMREAAQHARRRSSVPSPGAGVAVAKEEV